MTGVIDESLVEAYERDGAVCLRGVVDPTEATRMAGVVDRLIASGEGRVRIAKVEGDPGQFYSNAFMARSIPEFMDFAANTALPAAAARLMRCDAVRYYYDQIFVKEPLTRAPTQWHQDLPFWPFQGNDLVSLWVALLPASVETSGVEYIAGSHKWGKFYRAVTPDEDPRFSDMTLERCPDHTLNRDPSLTYLSWSLQPGDVVAHHPLVVHGAGGNNSATQRRMGLSIRYLGRDVRWDPRQYVMRLPVEPKVPAGAYPADDEAFPPVGKVA